MKVSHYKRDEESNNGKTSVGPISWKATGDFWKKQLHRNSGMCDHLSLRDEKGLGTWTQ